MKYYIQDFCFICLGISNEKCSNDSSKYTDKLSPLDKIKTVFLGLSDVMDNDSRICLKCCANIDSIYNFHKTCLKNIQILYSYKKMLKENKSKKQCDLFVNFNELKQFNGNVPIGKEIKMEPPEDSLNLVDPLCGTNFVSECHSSEVTKVKEEIELNYETCDEASERFRVNPEIKLEVQETDAENELMNGINKTSEDNSLQPNIKGFENISSQLTEEVFVKEEENLELPKNQHVEVVEKKSDEPQEYYELIKQAQSTFRFILPKPINAANKQFDCVECGKTLNCKSDLDNHMIIHLKRQTQTEQQSHKCDICGKSFNQKSILKSHMLIHTCEKSHKCDVCEKFFSDSSTLRRHKLTHTGEKPHKCSICGKSFTQMGTLKTHMLTHTGEKPYKCDICDKSFNRKQHLNVHKLTHTGERPHICGNCGIGFHQKGCLKTHMLIHTGEKPHKCNICGKLFNQKVNLTTHLKTHHGDHLPQMS